VVPADRPRLGISRCLLGDAVRYDGGHKRDPYLVETLGRDVEWVPVCPEVEMGMSTPREPIHLVVAPGGGSLRLVGVDSGYDWTQTMRTFAQRRVRELAGMNLSGYVLKKDSPSCGLEDVKVIVDRAVTDARAEALAWHSGRGLFAQALVEAFPDLPIEEEGRLEDAGQRAAFVERVFAYWRRHADSGAGSNR
jgi:uncharacterized protein YbbK (DUF523 family)